MRRRILVAINPYASFGRARDAGPRAVALLKAAGHDVRPLLQPSYELLAERTREELEAGADALVVVGGDGMVHLAVNLLGGTTTPLGLVPTGTGNDFAKSIGVPEHDVDAAIGGFLAALGEGPTAFDTGLATWEERGAPVTRRFVGAVSCGFDALVNERANRMRRPKGAARYQLAIARELVGLRRIGYRIVHDGDVIELDGTLVSVANHRSIGGVMRIVPDADLADGMLDLFVVEALSRTGFLRLYPRVFGGTHVGDPRVRIVRTTRARVELQGQQRPVIAYADGERLGPLPIDVVVDPGSLRCLGATTTTAAA